MGSIKLKWWQWGLVGFFGLGLIGSIFNKPTQTAPAPVKEESKPAVVQVDDGCNSDVAFKYVERWAKQKPQLIGVKVEGFPAIVTTSQNWLALGEKGQILTAAIVDCASAGKGNHLSSLNVTNLQGDVLKRFDAVQLKSFREMAKDAISKPPVD